MSRHVVILDTGRDRVCYGPFFDSSTASRFAAYLAAEVDPATVAELKDPTAELLAWYRHEREVDRG